MIFIGHKVYFMYFYKSFQTSCVLLELSRSGSDTLLYASNSLLHVSIMAQRKRAGPITLRSVDRNYLMLSFFAIFLNFV